MKAILIAIIFSFAASAGALEIDQSWRDCNIPANEAYCQAKFQAHQAKKAELQRQYSGQELLRKVCEELHVCGSGGNAGSGGAAGGA